MPLGWNFRGIFAPLFSLFWGYVCPFILALLGGIFCILFSMFWGVSFPLYFRFLGGIFTSLCSIFFWGEVERLDCKNESWKNNWSRTYRLENRPETDWNRLNIWKNKMATAERKLDWKIETWNRLKQTGNLFKKKGTAEKKLDWKKMSRQET